MTFNYALFFDIFFYNYTSAFRKIIVSFNTFYNDVQTETILVLSIF